MATVKKTQPLPAGTAVARSLRANLEMINRVHTALRATLQVEDLYSIILATVVSEQGLGFDRAYLFLYDDRQEVFRGGGAMGAETAERHRAIRREIREESRWFSERAATFNEEKWLQGDEDEWARGFEGLLSHAFWIDTIQEFSPGNPLDRLIRDVEFPCKRCPPEKRVDCLCQLSEARHSLGVPWSSAQPHPFLAEKIGRPALGAALQTKKGLRGVLVADLAFSGLQEVPRAKRALFDWFVIQAATALENCELYGDLQQAYTDLHEIETIKSGFLSTISHELRTPLTAITGFSEVLATGRAGDLSERQQELLSRIRRHAGRLAGIVDDLLEIAEATAGGSAILNLEPVDPLEALMNTIPRLEHRTKAKEVIIEPLIAGAIPRIVANGKAVERVLYHLLDNAVKFTPKNGLVTVGFERRDGRLRIAIKDSGIGISEENLKKIFGGFYQVDSRLSRNYEGLGIGLTLTKKLLNAMAGSIEVQSRLGQGSCFSVEFRIAREEETHVTSA